MGKSHVPEGADSGYNSAQAVNALFALGAAAIVFTGSDFVLDHGVTDDELNGGRRLHGFVFERTAVEQKRIRGPAKARNELIHDANVRADKFVLGFLTKASQLLAIG